MIKGSICSRIQLVQFVQKFKWLNYFNGFSQSKLSWLAQLNLKQKNILYRNKCFTCFPETFLIFSSYGNGVASANEAPILIIILVCLVITRVSVFLAHNTSPYMTRSYMLMCQFSSEYTTMCGLDSLVKITPD